MDQMFNTDDIEELLSQRADVLQCIATGPKHNRDLQEELDISRSTAYKALNSLQERSLITKTENGYTLTLTGRLLLAEYQEFRSTLDDIRSASELLSTIPTDNPVPAAMMEDAEIEFPTPYAPNKPVTSITQAIREASVVRGASPVVLPEYVEVFLEQVRTREFRATVLLERPVVEHLQERYADQLEVLCRSGQIDVLTPNRSIPFGVVVVDQPNPEVLLVVYGSNGDLKGIIRNTNENAVAWGKKTWEELRAEAQRINDGDTTPTEQFS